MKGPKPLTILIKLGTSSIVDEQTHEPMLSNLSSIVETVVRLRKDGHKVIVVSSGAIGVGLSRMGIAKRPKHLPRMQAIAAIGQCRLISLWDSLFAHFHQPIGQVLITRNDIADRTQYLNAQNTFAQLLEMGVIPIVNENDTIAVTEIKFGDNDTLSAITAAMVHADYLFLMTDVDCLYDKNPRIHPDAKPVEVVDDISSLSVDVSTSGSALGTGGMSTKIVAARLASSAGVTTVITHSSEPSNIISIVRYAQSLKPPPSSSTSRSNSRASSPASPANRRLNTNPPPLSITSDPFSNHTPNHVTNHKLLPSSPLTPANNKVENLRRTPSLKIDRSATPANSSPTSSPTNSINSHPNLLDTANLSPSFASLHSPPEDFKEIPKHTRFIPLPHPIRDRYFWLLFGLAPHGTIYIDAGAHRALTAKAGLLPVGVVDVEGNFAQQEAVRIVVVERASSNASRTSSPVSPAKSEKDHNGMPPRATTYDGVGPGLTLGAMGLPKDSFGKGVNGGPGSDKSAWAGEGIEVGRALVNYSAGEIARIKGRRSSEIQELLGYAESEYVALRENISFFDRGVGGSRPVTPVPV